MNGALVRVVSLGLVAANPEDPAWTELWTASDEFVRSFAIARVFLSVGAIGELDQLNTECSIIMASKTVVGLERLEKLREPIWRATDRLTSAAKEDLRFRED